MLSTGGAPITAEDCLSPSRAPSVVCKKDDGKADIFSHRILEKAFQSAGLNGKPATHSMRKTYAQRMYDATGDIFMIKEALGHKSVETTRQYLGVSYKKMQAASKAIELSSNRRGISLHSSLNDSDLILELAKRGWDISSIIDQLQEKEKRDAKIIKFPKVV